MRAWPRRAGGCLLVQLAVIYLPWLQAILQTEALSLGDLLSIFVLASSVLWVDEARKLIARKREGQDIAMISRDHLV